MGYKDHTKKISELRKSNTQIDMKVRERLEKIVDETLDKDIAISFDFLIDHLHLEKKTENAMQELKLHVNMIDDVKYGVITDDTDQSVYVFFKKVE